MEPLATVQTQGTQFLVEKRWFIDSKQGNIKQSYKFVKKLGRGGYGTVYMAENKETGEKVAIKAI